MNEKKSTTQIAFHIILHAGNARSNAMEAIQAGKKYHFNEAERLMQNAESQFVKAHQIQASLMKREALGEDNELSLMLIHAEDHLMTALTVKELANEMIEMYQKIQQLGG